MRRYFFYDESLAPNEQDLSPDEMIRNQVHFYHRAVEEILEETSICFAKIYKKHGFNPKKDGYNRLFLLDGTRVRNLLDIPKEATVLIASDRSEYMGVEFENVAVTELEKKMPLLDLV
jgi:hypothetical protein